MTSIKLENRNFKNKKTGDCVTRALMVALDLSYQETAKLQFDTWMKTGYHLGDKKNYSQILEDYGFVKSKMPKKFLDDEHKKFKRYTVGEINLLVHPSEVAFIDLANHSTVYKNQSIIDIWDCRKKSISNYWVKEDNSYEISLNQINRALRKVRIG